MKQAKRVKRLQAGSGTIPKLTDELNFKSIHEDLNSYLKTTKDAPAKHAKAALARLVAAGCDERVVLQNLYLFCGGKPEDMKAVRTALNFEGKRKRMLAIAALLKEAISEIQVAEQLLEELDYTHTLKPDCVALDKYADFIGKVGERVYGDLGYMKISGRDQHLDMLCRIVKKTTGKSHYKEIAELVYAVKLRYDPLSAEPETAGSIKERWGRQSRNFLLDLELQATSEPEVAPPPAERSET